MHKTLEDLITDLSFRRHILNPNQADVANWKEWKNESEINESIYNEAKEIITGFYMPLDADEYEEETLKFRRRVNITPTEKNNITSLYGYQKQKNPGLRYAAAIIVLITASVILYNFLFQAEDVSDQQESKIINIIKKEAGKGQKLTITFPDGSVVKLNSESQITYPEQFSGDFRKVELIGEAYFDIAHHENWPFIVKSENTEIRVLGTSFNVTAYPEEETRVALVHGSVQVTTNVHSPITLQPMEMLTIMDEAQKVEVTPFDIRKTTAWKDNVIIFEKASFKEVQYALERWYNVKFHYEKAPIFKGGYTGEFNEQSLENVLKGMSSNKFRFRIEGKDIYIH